LSIQRLRRINGEDIVIAHPDSGWTPHSNLNFINVAVDPVSDSFDLNRDWNSINDDSSAEESLSNESMSAFHGTATSSIMVGKEIGIAEKATVLPIRCVSKVGGTGVILLFNIDVVRAIWYAITQNVDIISLSLGGLPCPPMEAVLAHAVYNNIIVVAAAGNCVNSVVYPAGYPEVIAIGASTIDNLPWEYSASGSKVAFSVPGSKICCASWDFSNQNPRETIHKSSGTSFSTAITAGVAALWLQYYDKNSLIGLLNGSALLQEAFLHHVKSTARVPLNWNVNNNGVGIINVQALFSPNSLNNALSTNFQGEDWNNWKRKENMELLYGLYENIDPVIIKERLERYLSIANIEMFMDKVGNELFTLIQESEDMYNDFSSIVNEASNDIEETVEDFMDKVGNVASKTLKLIFG